MPPFFANHCRPTCYVLVNILAILLLPQLAHAEAFKGGFLSSGGEKALFFILFLFGLALVISTIAILIGIFEWLQTGKNTKLKNYLPKILMVIILGAALTFITIVTTF